MPGTAGPITLHSSWRGILSALVSGLLLGGIGGWAALASDFRIVPTVVALIGLGIVLVALFDYPVATRFDLEGAHRRMVLRRQTIRWDRVRQLTRTRPSLVRGTRPLRPGGLAAVVGRRRYLLVDQVESVAEFDALLALLDPLDDALGLSLLNRPPESAIPTWTYRRRKWGAAGRTDAR